MIEISDENEAQKLISIFVCKNDPDIECFLKDRAIKFEKLGKSRTFLIYNEDADHVEILGYFTIALQVLKIPEGFISGKKIQLLDGLSSNLRGSRITEFPTILIGQLGKNDLHRGTISGSEIMEYCLAMILEGQKRLGGRIIMLECKNVPYLINLYQKFDFKTLMKDYGQDELIQMIRILDENELMK